MELLTHSPACERILEEFREMPGMQLTARQIERLCALDDDSCRIALDELTQAGALVHKRGAVYALSPAEVERLALSRRDRARR
jgi:hypothetical protein